MANLKNLETKQRTAKDNRGDEIALHIMLHEATGYRKPFYVTKQKLDANRSAYGSPSMKGFDTLEAAQKHFDKI